MSGTLRLLNACGCCTGTAAETPGKVWNRPGLSAIAYRAGTHPDFKASMLARLSSGFGALHGLRTRDDGDFSIAFLDAFATVADVLTFYQERIAQEHYLRTATERRSVVELARLIGYELDPGVAATVHLAFTIDDAPGAFGRALSIASTMPTAPEEPPTVLIPVGTKVQTVPGPDELPQMFETVEEIAARAEWNAMKPRLTRPQTIDADMASVYLAGLRTLKRGDRVLISAGTSRALRVVRDVELQNTEDRTLVTFESTGTAIVQAVSAAAAAQIVVVGKTFSQATANVIASASWSAESLQSMAMSKGWDMHELAASIVNAQPPAPVPPVDDGLFAMRQQAAIFAYNAPTVSPTNPPTDASWNNDTLETYASASGNRRYIYLDRVYDELLPNTWMTLEAPGVTRRYLQILAVEHIARTQSMISGKCTRVVVETGSLGDFKIRDTTARVQAERLTLAQEPIATPLERNQLLLGRYYAGLAKGRAVAVTGAPADVPAVIRAEIRTITEVRLEGTLTRITLDADLANSFIRTTAAINANVAFATHGETVSEILGSGDATQPFQRFRLKQPRLTWVGADNDTGSVSTLSVRVNDVLWEEVPFLYGHGPEERVYTIRMDDDGNSYVTFGDGRTGARLPTGDSNVTAVYRRGIGTAGHARVGQITQPMNKPVGVKGVTNPQKAVGGGDWEALADARTNASLTALTLGRVVSLRDYEDFARAYPGIGKASATWSWSGERRQILLTVAGDGGARIESGSDLAKRLLSAVRKLGDPRVALTIAPHDALVFYLRAKVKVDPRYLRDKVFADVRARLREAFSFEARSFGQAVSRAEVVSVMHAAEGVIAVDLDELYSSEGSASVPVARIGAQPLTKNGPARMLTLDTASEVRLEVMP